MRTWFGNVRQAVRTIAAGLNVTLGTMVQTFRRRTFASHFEYPERPVPVRPRYRGFHRFDLTTCIGCDKCARACPVDCIYIDKEKVPPPGKGFLVTGFKIDYTKCMFCTCAWTRARSIASSWGRTSTSVASRRDGCVVDYAKLPLEVAWGQATLSPTAVHESKKVPLPVWVKPAEAPKPPAVN